MKYYNINDPSRRVDLRTAVLSGIAGENGLFMPDHIPVMSASFYNRLSGMGLKEIASEVAGKMLGGDIPEDAIGKIVNKALSYEIPLRQLDENIYVLELFHGPTLAFKDTGARFMAALFEYLLDGRSDDITILVATSGDTGSAVANAFYRCKGIRVIILYPSGRVSNIQEKMITSMGENIAALEVMGDFDDCQRLVKEAFSDRELNSLLNLTSANSINFARLFPQTFYYFHAVSQLKEIDKPIAISVPSGNFGNLTAGLMAYRMGLDIRHFIAATNANHSVVDYLETGKFVPEQAKHTITNAMDVGDPGNFPRILSLFKSDHSKISSLIKGYWFTDASTRDAMNELQERFGYQADPHGAVAWLGLKRYMEKNDACGIFLETAHPVKFQAEVEESTYIGVKIPESLNDILSAKKYAIKIKTSFRELKRILLLSK